MTQDTCTITEPACETVSPAAAQLSKDELPGWAREQVAALPPFTPSGVHQAAMLARRLDERLALTPTPSGA